MADSPENSTHQDCAVKNWPPQRRILWCVAGPLIVAFCLPSLMKSLTPPEGAIFDFFKEWAAVQNWRADMPVYSKQSVALERHMSMKFDGEGGFLDEYNTHPPTANLIALPVAWLPYREAQLVWNLASLAMLSLTIVWIVSTLQIDFRPMCLLPLAALLVVCDPLKQSLIQGQPNLLLGLLIVGAWRFDQRDRPVIAGACLALATAIKLYPGFLFLYFLMRRDARAIVSGAVSFALITAITGAIFGFGAYRDYVQTVIPAIQIVTNNWGNNSLLAFWERVFGESHPGIQTWHDSPVLLTVSVWMSRVVLTLVVAVACWKADGRLRQSQAFGSTTAAMLLLSPTAWHHYFVLLALPVGVLLSLSAVGSFRRIVVNGVILALACGPRRVWLLLIPPTAGTDLSSGIPWNDGRMTALPWQSLTALSYQSYAMLAVVALLLLWRGNGVAQVSSARSASQSPSVKGRPDDPAQTVS